MKKGISATVIVHDKRQCPVCLFIYKIMQETLNYERYIFSKILMCWILGEQLHIGIHIVNS